MNQLSKAILKLMEKDEKEAFRLLFEHYYDSLLLYSLHVLNDLAAAEDVVQDCFAILWTNKRLKNFEGDLDHFLFGMVKKRSCLYLQEHQRECPVPENLEREMSAEDCQPSETEQDEIDLLYRTIDKLPEKCKRVFLMASLHDKTYQEIADELDVSVNTVKTQMKYALKFLRDNLKKDDFQSILLLLTKKV